VDIIVIRRSVNVLVREREREERKGQLEGFLLMM